MADLFHQDLWIIPWIINEMSQKERKKFLDLSFFFFFFLRYAPKVSFVYCGRLPIRCPNFFANKLCCFCVLLLTIQPTNKQTNTTSLSGVITQTHSFNFPSSFFYWGDSLALIYTVMVIYSESFTNKNRAYRRTEEILNFSVITNTTVMIVSGTCCRRIQFDGAEKSNLV